MTQEELELRMQSIVLQQENTAKIVAGIAQSQDRLDKRQVEFDARQVEFDARQVEFDKRMAAIAVRQQTNSEEINLLYAMMRDSLVRQDKMEEQQRVVHEALAGLMAMSSQTSRKVEELQKTTEAKIEEAQKATETQLTETRDRLDIFINVLERYISQNRNGNNTNQH